MEQLKGINLCCFGVFQPGSPSPPGCAGTALPGAGPSPDPIALGLQGTGLVGCEDRTSSRQVESKPAKKTEQSIQELSWTVFVPAASPQDETE